MWNIKFGENLTINKVCVYLVNTKFWKLCDFFTIDFLGDLDENKEISLFTY